MKALDAFVKLFRKIPVKYRFPVWVATAFLAMISFFNVNSVFADNNHLNGFFTVVGIILSVAVLAIGYTAWTEEKEIEDEEKADR